LDVWHEVQTRRRMETLLLLLDMFNDLEVPTVCHQK
jgi:hypothetical protein